MLLDCDRVVQKRQAQLKHEVEEALALDLDVAHHDLVDHRDDLLGEEVVVNLDLHFRLLATEAGLLGLTLGLGDGRGAARLADLFLCDNIADDLVDDTCERLPAVGSLIHNLRRELERHEDLEYHFGHLCQQIDLLRDLLVQLLLALLFFLLVVYVSDSVHQLLIIDELLQSLARGDQERVLEVGFEGLHPLVDASQPGFHSLKLSGVHE